MRAGTTAEQWVNHCAGAQREKEAQPDAAHAPYAPGNTVFAFMWCVRIGMETWVKTTQPPAGNRGLSQYPRQGVRARTLPMIRGPQCQDSMHHRTQKCNRSVRFPRHCWCLVC
jgi:hypothetical protein